MVVLKNDFIRLHLDVGVFDIPCQENKIDWPPPEKLVFGAEGIREAKEDDPDERILARRNMSQLTDEQADSKYLARGAEYKYRGAEYKYLADIH